MELAHEWEARQSQPHALGEAEEIDEGSKVFISSARKLGAIIDLYRSNTHIYSEQAQSTINALIAAAEPSDEYDDQSTSLITAIQRIHAETENTLAGLRQQVSS